MSGLTEPQLDPDQFFVWTEAATSPVVGSHCDRESAGFENRPFLQWWMWMWTWTWTWTCQSCFSLALSVLCAIYHNPKTCNLIEKVAYFFFNDFILMCVCLLLSKPLVLHELEMSKSALHFRLF